MGPPPPPPRVIPAKPTSIIPDRVNVLSVPHPITIHGTLLGQMPKHKHHHDHHHDHHHKHHHEHEHHHEHGHHEHHHKHHEHFMGLDNLTCQTACHGIASYLTMQNIVLILVIVLLGYYISSQKK